MVKLSQMVVDRYATLCKGEHMPETQLIGSAEAARILHTSQRTVTRLVASGQLPVMQTIPGGYAGIHLYERAEVERVKAERDATRASA